MNFTCKNKLLFWYLSFGRDTTIFSTVPKITVITRDLHNSKYHLGFHLRLKVKWDFFYYLNLENCYITILPKHM